MISMLMFLMSLAAQRHIDTKTENDIHHAVLSVAALADGMTYYQTQAIQNCWQSEVMVCPAGIISLRTRLGSQNEISYGNGYETSTDGSSYIMTTLASKGDVVGRTTKESNINSGVFAALKSMNKDSTSVGYYDIMAGGVVLPEKENAVVSVTFQTTPVQGQPVLYSSIVTALPPALVASIGGGGYSPLVPIPPSVTPVPVSPAAVVSPPASISPPEPTSPTYAPPATVVVKPISPWAPSPVPPPPPPPPSPPPPVPPTPTVTPEQVALAKAAKTVSYLGWGPIVSHGTGKLSSQIHVSKAIEIWLMNDSGNIIYSFYCIPNNDITKPLVSDGPYTDVGGIVATNTSSDQQCKAASDLIQLFISSGNAFYNDMERWARVIGFPQYDSIIETTIHSYGITTMGSFGMSDVAFSGNSSMSYFSSRSLYGGGVPEPTSSDVGKGLTYDQSALADQYISTMTNGSY